MKYTAILERVQRQATKFILRDYNSDYRTRLLKLDLLPLMYLLDFCDIGFLYKSTKAAICPFQHPLLSKNSKVGSSM